MNNRFITFFCLIFGLYYLFMTQCEQLMIFHFCIISFDVNVLYDYIDLLILGYSSATTDAIAKDKMTLEYCPDYEDYKNNDRGFVNDYENYHIGNTVYDKDDLFHKILVCLSTNVKSLKRHTDVKKFLLGERVWSIDEIVRTIIEVD